MFRLLRSGGGSITALAEVAKADTPAAAAPAASTDQAPASPEAPADKTDAPAAVEPDVNTVAQVTSPDGKTTANYDSLSGAILNATDGIDSDAKGSTITIVKNTAESVTVNKVVKITAKPSVVYSGTMTLTKGAKVTGVHFTIDDVAANAGVTSSLVIESGNSAPPHR